MELSVVYAQNRPDLIQCALVRSTWSCEALGLLYRSLSISSQTAAKHLAPSKQLGQQMTSMLLTGKTSVFGQAKYEWCEELETVLSRCMEVEELTLSNVEKVQ